MEPDATSRVGEMDGKESIVLVMNMFNLSGFWGLVILVLDVWALVSIINSTRDTGAKVLWALLVLLLPVLGFIIWFFAGPRARR